MKQRLLILGGTSSIAQAFCRTAAAKGASFRLVGRHQERLQCVADDLLIRGAEKVDVSALEPGGFPGLKAVVAEDFRAGKGYDLFLAAQGSLPSQEMCERDPESIADVFDANAIEVMQAALLVASHFETQGHGTCVIIGSVAGDRGRKSNYVYGAAKASLEVFCDGLRQRLAPSVHVLLVKPGPVDTPMTAHLVKGLLFCSPEKVAADMHRAIRRTSAVLYTPFYWRWIMMIIRILPGKIVGRLRA